MPAREMSVRGIDQTLQLSVERKEYVVDSSAVAEAVLRSWMLVAPEPVNGTVGAEQDEAAAA
jgi:hypothetical protein